MSSVLISLMRAPGARLILNNLLTSMSTADLDQDLVLVELPGQIFIDVSWYPENDPHGHFYVTVFEQNRWDAPFAEARADSAIKAAFLVEMLAERFMAESPSQQSRGVGPISCSQQIDKTYIYVPVSAA